MPALTVTAAFSNAAITAVEVVQVRRKKNSRRKHPHAVKRHPATRQNPNQPTGPTNPWSVTFNTAGIGVNHILLLRVVALDAAGNFVASVSVPARPHP